MSRMSPADALGYIREEIAALKQREAELKARLIAEGVEAGEAYEVEFCEVRRKVFRYDRLPRALLCDPRYWDERFSIELRVVERTVDFGRARLSA
ncbi:MAG: hypothetical protein OQK05_08430 [Pseudopelagicola sp.]|nr:hypothetical protein [Pseudopelagicola sp.]